MRVFRRVMLGGGIDINAIPETQKLYYTATAKIEPLEGSLGSRVLVNKYDATTGEGVIATAKEITAIDDNAFNGNTALTSIKFSQIVKRVGKSAFQDTLNLKELWLSTGNAIFESDAFANTGIIAVKTEREYSMNGYNGPLDMVITNSCENERACPFYSKNAVLYDGNSITTGGTITNNIANYSVAGISGIEMVHMICPNGTPNYSVGNGAFYNSPSSLYIIFPSNSAIVVGHSAFRGSNIKAIQGMEYVTELDFAAFAECKNLSSYSRPIYLTARTIPQAAFRLSHLNEVVITESVKVIEHNAFGDVYHDAPEGERTTIAKLYFPPTTFSQTEDNVVNGGAFCNCHIGECFFNTSFEDSDYSSPGLYGAYIDKLTIGETVTHIGCRVFQRCTFNYDTLTLPDTIISIGDEAFQYITVNTVVIPDSVVQMGDHAFGSPNIKNIIIGNGITEISRYQYGSINLISLVIGNGVTKIKAAAFYGYSAMQYYDFSTHIFVPTIDKSVFYSIPTTCKIIVPDDLYDEWIAATNWSTYASYIIKKSDWDASQTTE